ncbi:MULTISPECIES: hypothetical protein [Cupriavidus]
MASPPDGGGIGAGGAPALAGSTAFPVPAAGAAQNRLAVRHEEPGAGALSAGARQSRAACARAADSSGLVRDAGAARGIAPIVRTAAFH